MICEACGESNRLGTEFCTYCGSYLAWDPSAPDKSMVRPAPTGTAPAPATTPPVSTSPPAPIAPATPPPPIGLNESLPGRIFICYRRQETAWPALRLYDVLVQHFPAERVLKDIRSIEPGDDIVERITAEVAFCDVLLALIGPQWLTMTDNHGQRRLDNPDDFVRLEIETALKRKIRLIPILVDDARMPRADELPPTLAPLVRRNAVEINPLTFDTTRLMATVRKTLELELAHRQQQAPGPGRTISYRQDQLATLQDEAQRRTKPDSGRR